MTEFSGHAIAVALPVVAMRVWFAKEIRCCWFSFFSELELCFDLACELLLCSCLWTGCRQVSKLKSKEEQGGKGATMIVF
jgi:hypothetical protein